MSFFLIFFSTLSGFETLTRFFALNLSQPDLSGNPFFALGKALAKKIGSGRRIKLPKKFPSSSIHHPKSHFHLHSSNFLLLNTSTSRVCPKFPNVRRLRLRDQLSRIHRRRKSRNSRFPRPYTTIGC